MSEIPTQRMVTAREVREHPTALAYINGANANLRLLGYTEHGMRHVGRVSSWAYEVLHELGYAERDCELAAIAGLLHDIGNVINRQQHGQIGALLARDILTELGMDVTELVVVMGAIGNHEEERGHAVSAVAAALILADKADVHRSRVQEPDPSKHDIHDRVNLAATDAKLRVEQASRRIVLELAIDSAMASVMDYFGIFLSRMVMCRQAAAFLGCRFGLVINGTVLE
ncbi:MAG: HD domain-containing protein [Chloroflexi bacterium OHK40]